MSDRVVLASGSEAETHAIGRRLGAVLRGGERIGLAGELGAGKTCLVRGIAAGMGIPPHVVHSPSFTLVAVYDGGRLPLTHIDLFRCESGGLEPEELREYLYGDGVCAVEWFGHLAEPLEDYLEIELTFVGSASRRLVAVGRGVRYDRAVAALSEASGG